MNFKACLTLLILTGVLLDDAAAWGRVVRNVNNAVRKVIKPICKLDCPTVCIIAGTVAELPPVVTGTGCHIVCKNICKRNFPSFAIRGVQYEVVPISRDFSHYDLNGDEFISPVEFSTVLNLPLEEVYDVFKVADVDGDQMLDTNEFEQAPFVFKSEMEDGTTDLI